MKKMAIQDHFKDNFGVSERQLMRDLDYIFSCNYFCLVSEVPNHRKHWQSSFSTTHCHFDRRRFGIDACRP